MAADPIADVRRFNRTVTTRVGALDDRFMGLDRPMGEARVLWEIGPDGRELRELRSRLGLDSGYLTRLVQSLEAAGLVTVAPGEADRRTRVASLTPAGLAERRILDERSDAVAQALLDPLTGPQQEELVAAMRCVQRLLSAGAVQIGPVDPEHADARRCVAAYYDELEQRAGLEREAALAVVPDLVLVAYLHGRAIGTGSLKHASGEIKRLWVDPEARGLGVGRRLLAELEEAARKAGASTVRLDTNRELTEAIAMYRADGYVEVAPYNDEPFAHHWFEKRL